MTAKEKNANIQNLGKIKTPRDLVNRHRKHAQKAHIFV